MNSINIRKTKENGRNLIDCLAENGRVTRRVSYKEITGIPVIESTREG